MIPIKKPTFQGLARNQLARFNKNRRHMEAKEREIRKNLMRLKELLPSVDKEERISKLQIIHRVIQYIGDLERALEMPPTINSSAVDVELYAAECNMLLASSQRPGEALPIVAPVHRQPLGVLPPNVNGTMNTSNSSLDSSPISSSRQSDKVSSTTDSKTVPH